jgi:predicted TIM-barrel fold metal-dependent hydrolase
MILFSSDQRNHNSVRRWSLPCRRDFLKRGMALAGASAILASGSYEADPKPEPRRQGDARGFIDSHVHVWTNDFKHYPISPQFTPHDMVPTTFLPEDILRTARPSGVTRIVLIQVRFYGFDNSYMVETIRRSPSVFRGVAVVDWKGSHPDVEMRKLEKHGVRGFRIRAEGPSPMTFLNGESVEKMFRCGAKERLAICLLLDPENLPALGQRCERLPETPVVIDHLARVGTTRQLVESDIQLLCALAKYPEVKVKVSAFYGAGAKRPLHLDLVPFIRRLYDTFGPQRLMWGSDCPYQLATETYEDSISLVRDHLSFLSPDDKEWLLRKTAESTFFTR